ncbi:hypothetical protein OV203_38445 [Nannocystis sp. ILAH1]|uniref:hypothetical protein n=1 Tax=Nannocystis sp. ILAH1 TaxID=2996789 RepID=UPI00226F404A|nr:hypothetical protein [Nannocystis sp. ILAH1]MCY0993086.1 hypothetical protein [Nannocystis sp. ILAH1]
MMLRRCLLPALALLLACGDDFETIPADCTRAEPVQLVAGPYHHYDLQRARDTTYFAMWGNGTEATYAGSVCGADPVLIAEGMRMLPTRIALDPLEDDPTLVCDDDNGDHYRVDLGGERAPELLLPYLGCKGRPTEYGVLFGGGWGYLHLFADFPDPSSVTEIRDDGGNFALVLDEWVVYTHASDLHAYEFATGEIIDIPGKVLGMAGRGDHVIWHDYEDIATVTLVDLRSNTSTVLGKFDRDAAWDGEQYLRDFPYWGWGFDPSGRYVYHFFPGLPPEAFDLDGRPVALPAPGEILELFDDGVLSVDRGDGQVYFTRPGDATPTALDLRLQGDENVWNFESFADHVEDVVDGDLVRADFDGSPARVLVRGVTGHPRWIDERVLVTQHDDGALERIDAETDERTILAERTDHWRYVNGGVYFLRTDSPDPADDGLWYLSSVALGVNAAGP